MKRREPPEELLEDLSTDARIPELRKKEKEDKKGAGVFWGSGAPGTGGALARAGTGGFWNPFGLGALAGSLALRVGAGSFFGRLLLSRIGGWALLGMVLGGGGLLGLGVALGLAGPGGRHLVAQRFNAESPSSAPRQGSSPDSLSFVAEANRGSLGEEEAAKAKSEPETLADAAAALPASPITVEAPMTAGEGGPVNGPRAAAGTLNKMADLQSSRPLQAGAGPSGLATSVLGSGTRAAADVNVGDGRRGNLGALPRGRGRAAASSLRGRGAISDRAMGQLKFARNESSNGANAARETASRQFATDAFDQIKTQGGALAGGPGASGTPEVVMPPGTGAPNPDRGSTPPVGPTQNATPYQPQLDAAKNMAEAAQMLQIMGMLLMAAGAALMYVGYKMMSMPPPYAMMGKVLIVAGLAVVGAGVMALSMAQNMADAAEKMGDQIKAQGQEKQGQIATDNAKAKADGKPYTPPDMTDKVKPNGELKKAVEDERNADFKLK